MVEHLSELLPFSSLNRSQKGRLEKTTIDVRSINEEEYFGYFLIIVILMVILFSPCRYHFLPRANLWNTE